MLFATIFLVCFVILGGLVMYLARTIEHGEARFDASGIMISGGTHATGDHWSQSNASEREQVTGCAFQKGAESEAKREGWE